MRLGNIVILVACLWEILRSLGWEDMHVALCMHLWVHQKEMITNWSEGIG